jgi:hypothetical protein
LGADPVAVRVASRDDGVMPMPHPTSTPPVGVSAPPPTDAGAPYGRPDAAVFDALATFDVPLPAERVRALVRDRLLAEHPRLQRVPDLTRPAAADEWAEDEAFDLDLHVHRRALGAPGDRRALRELVAAVTQTPLDPRRPPWAIVCVDGYRSGGALVARLDRRLVADPKAFVDLLAEQLGGRREPLDTCRAAVAVPGRRRG